MNATWRKENRSLDYLKQHHQPLDAKTVSLIELMPRIGEELQSQAREAALLFVPGKHNVSRAFRYLGRAVSGRQALITQCIFDLLLTVYFAEAFECCGNMEIASLLTDALLYQATGSEPGSATKQQFLENATQAVRGVQKYKLASEMGWKEAGYLFGKEIAALQGHSGDFLEIASVEPRSLELRVYAKWRIRYFLYGEFPTKTEQEKARQFVVKVREDLHDLFTKKSSGEKVSQKGKSVP